MQHVDSLPLTLASLVIGFVDSPFFLWPALVFTEIALVPGFATTEAFAFQLCKAQLGALGVSFILISRALRLLLLGSVPFPAELAPSFHIQRPHWLTLQVLWWSSRVTLFPWSWSICPL